MAATEVKVLSARYDVPGVQHAEGLMIDQSPAGPGGAA